MKATLTRTKSRLNVDKICSGGIMPYDSDNDYPSRVVDIIMNSGMGSSCVKLYHKFVFGNGFEDQDFASQIVNRKGETINHILYLVSKDYTNTGGFSIHVNFNLLGEITEINWQPFEQVRITAKDNKDHPYMLAVKKEWKEENYRYTTTDKDIKYFNWFNPDKVEQEIEKSGGIQNYRGQIFYSDKKYPTAMFDSVLEDMQTDSKTKTYKFRNVTTNFLSPYMLLVDKVESNNDDSDKGGKEKDTLDEGLEDYQGADNAMKIMKVELDHPEQTFDLKKLDIQSGDKLFEWTENSTRDNIRQSFMIPSVLLQTIPGKLGTSQEILDATRYYNNITSDERLFLAKAFEAICSIFVEPLNPSDNYNISKKDVDNHVLADKIGRENMKLLVNIMTNGKLTPQQKSNTIQVLFGINEDEANKMTNADNAGTNTTV